MIVPRQFEHGLYYLLPEATKGQFHIKKGCLHKGAWIKDYSPIGAFYIDKPSDDFPTVRLTEGDDTDSGCWMSDMPLEQHGLYYPLRLAHGDVLVFGLGLGLYPHLLTKHNKSVRSITIIEREQDVIDLVFPHIRRAMMSVVTTSAADYVSRAIAKGLKYDFIYIDIWPDIIEPIKDASDWLLRVKPILTEHGSARVWLQELYERVARRLPKEPIANPGFPAIYEPCLICGKKLRHDYGGLCMDCADDLGVSELFASNSTKELTNGQHDTH